MDHGKPKKQDWMPLIDRVKLCLAGWKSKCLPLGGRLALVNYVLALSTYLMSFYELPGGISRRYLGYNITFCGTATMRTIRDITSSIGTKCA